MSVESRKNFRRAPVRFSNLPVKLSPCAEQPIKTLKDDKFRPACDDSVFS